MSHARFGHLAASVIGVGATTFAAMAMIFVARMLLVRTTDFSAL